VRVWEENNAGWVCVGRACGADWVLVRRLHVRDGRGKNFSNFFWCGAGLNFAGARREADKCFNRCRSLVRIGVGVGTFFGARRHVSRIFPKLPEKSLCSEISQKKPKTFLKVTLLYNLDGSRQFLF